MTTSAKEWARRYAESLGVDPPTDQEFEGLLALAAEAAHNSERTAAPVTTWIAARAQIPVTEALTQAETLTSELKGS